MYRLISSARSGTLRRARSCLIRSGSAVIGRGVVLERFHALLSSDGDDLEMIIEADQVGGVARIQTGIVRMRRCSDQQVERPRPGLSSDMCHRSGKTPVRPPASSVT